MALQIRRGIEVERFNPTTSTGPVFAEGELVYITDTDALYIGDGATQGGLRVGSEDLARLALLLIADNSGAGASGNVKLNANLDLNTNNVIGVGNIDIDGTIRATGNINLGDNASQDTVTLGAEVNSNITPKIDETYNIGNTTKRWMNGFFSGLDVSGNINATSVTGNIVSNDSTLLVNTATNTIFANVLQTPRLEGDSGTLTVATDTVFAELATFQKDVTVNTEITSPSFIGALTGNVTGNVTGDVTGDVTGNLTGDTTGNHIGNVTGDVVGVHTGNVFGNVVGNITGDVTGSIFADDSTLLVDAVNGKIVGNIEGDTTGTHTGPVIGDVTGNVVGNVTGNVTGDTAGTHTGPVTGDVTGNVTGNVTGDVEGDLSGSVFASDSSVLVDAVDGSIPALNIKGALSDNDITGDLYSRFNGTLIVDTSANPAIFNGNVTGILTGNVNSTGTSTMNAVNVTTALTADTLTVANGITGNLTGDVSGDIIGNLLAATTNANDIDSSGTISANTVIAGTVRGNALDGDLTGSVFAENSSVIVDAINRSIDADSITVNAVKLTSDNLQSSGNIFRINHIDPAQTLRFEFSDPVGRSVIDTQGITTGAIATNIAFNTSRGTPTVPNVVNPSDSLALITASGYDGAAQTLSSTIVMSVDGNKSVSVGDVPGKISFLPINSGALSGIGVTIDADSKMTVNRGYTTVAQATMDINGTMLLEPQTSAPTAAAGMIAVADGTTWDPASKGGALPYPVFYDGSAWNALY
jgi:hypothetical protein